MKYNNKMKLGIIGIILISVLLSLTPVVNASTTIEGSAVPVEEGDVYTWLCTESKYPSEVGGWYNLTIERIFQDSYKSVPLALVINATYGAYTKGTDFPHFSINHPDFLVHNASIDYYQCTIPMIFPVPFSITMVEGWWRAEVTNSCSVVGNTLVDEKSVDVGVIVYYSYNTEGLLTSIRSVEDEENRITFTLEGLANQIPFGDCFLILSFLAVVSVIYYTKI